MRFIKVSAIAASIMAISMMSESAHAALAVNTPPTESKAVSTATLVVDGGMAAHANKVYLGRIDQIVIYQFQNGVLDASDLPASVSSFVQSDDPANPASFTGDGKFAAFSNVQAQTFYVCHTKKLGIYRYTIAEDKLTRMIGDSTNTPNVIAAGTPQTGKDAKVACTATARQASALNDDGTNLYHFNLDGSGTNQALYKVVVGPTVGADLGVATNILFNAAAGATAGKDTTAEFQNPLAAAYYKGSDDKEYLIFTSDSSTAVRYIKLDAGTPANNEVVDTTITTGAAAADGTSGSLGGKPVAFGRVPEKPYAAGVVSDSTTAKSKFFLLTWADDLSEIRIDFDMTDRGVKDVSAGAIQVKQDNDVFLLTAADAGEKITEHLAFDAPATPSPPAGPNPVPAPGNVTTTASPTTGGSNNTIDSAIGSSLRALAAVCAGALAFSL